MRYLNSIIRGLPALALVVGSMVVTAPLSYSQSPENPAKDKPKEKESGPGVRAMLLVPAGPNIELISVTKDKTSEPFNVGALGLSDEFFPKATVFNLAIKDTKAENGIRSVATVTLPETGRHFIVLLEPKDANSFKYYVIDAKQPNFKANSLLFFNAADTPVAGAMDDKKFVVKPHEISILSAPTPKEGVPYFFMGLYRPEGETLRPFASNRWPHRDDARVYVFIYREAGSGRYAYQCVNESLIDPNATP